VLSESEPEPTASLLSSALLLSSLLSALSALSAEKSPSVLSLKSLSSSSAAGFFGQRTHI